MEQWEERAGNRAFLKFFCKTMLPGRAFLSHKRKEECVFCSFLRVLKTHGLQNIDFQSTLMLRGIGEVVRGNSRLSLDAASLAQRGIKT